MIAVRILGCSLMHMVQDALYVRVQGQGRWKVKDVKREDQIEPREVTRFCLHCKHNDGTEDNYSMTCQTCMDRTQVAVKQEDRRPHWELRED